MYTYISFNQFTNTQTHRYKDILHIYTYMSISIQRRTKARTRKKEIRMYILFFERDFRE